ncbi:MAG: GTPase HflX [Candidatus Gottesmanbacteria bacterium]|nr:GTPase HflX [Candidatus Gottesmanbacteria bacterium]
MEHSGQPITMLFVCLADAKLAQSEIEKNITELWNLASALGNATVVDIILQKGVPQRPLYIGPGKAREVADYINNHKVDVIVVDGALTPNQKFNLTKMYWDTNPKIEVWDRMDLILSIFSRHARTTEAKLQIEMARMRHMGPSIYGMGMILSRQAGGIGTRGLGETNTELMKRHWKREMKRVTEDLGKLKGIRERQIEHRRNAGLSTVSLVGYTNAGKTSLFNALTHKKNLVENALFATLDSAVGEIYMPELGKSIIISDTIGFIKDLPPELIEAFTSTLLESISADVVLHVIDASDPDIFGKIDIVEDILHQLGIPEEKVFLVFNKIDAIPELNREKVITRTVPYPHVFLSTVTREGMDELLAAILPRFKK